MAYRNPKAKFVGIDFSKEQILAAKEIRQQSGLKNLFYVEESFVGYQPPEGQKFDYVIAHGIFSWVSASEREELMKTILRSIHSGSVVYITYNTFPGWHFKSWIRDCLQLGQELLDDATITPADLTAFLKIVNTQSKLGVPPNLVDEVLNKAWPLLLHDELEVFNAPIHFKDFIKTIESGGLSYLCDSLSNSQHALKKLKIENLVKSYENWSLVEKESLMDLLVGRAHRNSVLVLEPKKVEGFRFENFFIRSPLRFSEDSTYVAEGVAVVKAQSKVFSSALELLQKKYPGFVSWQDLVGQLRQSCEQWSAELETELRERFFELISGGVVQISEVDILFSDRLGNNPRKHPLAIFNLRNSLGVVNALHQQISLTPELSALFQFCDASKSIEQICNDFSSKTNVSKEVCLQMLNDLREKFLIV